MDTPSLLNFRRTNFSILLWLSLSGFTESVTYITICASDIYFSVISEYLTSLPSTSFVLLPNNPGVSTISNFFPGSLYIVSSSVDSSMSNFMSFHTWPNIPATTDVLPSEKAPSITILMTSSFDLIVAASNFSTISVMFNPKDCPFSIIVRNSFNLLLDASIF